MKIEIKDLHVSIDGKKILQGLNLSLEKGKIYALMGPNGSGKSTLAQVLMGNPKYEVDSGDILIDGESILELSPDERAKKGLFLSFQYPKEIHGVTLTNFLRSAYNSVHDDKLSVIDFFKMLKEKMKFLNVPADFNKRYLNEGFSGGEKKKAEILQMMVLNPSVAILDETDSGLDVDALRIVAEGINAVKDGEKTFLLITHYNRILDYVVPDVVMVMKDGKITKEGGKELAKQIESEGFVDGN